MEASRQDHFPRVILFVVGHTSLVGEKKRLGTLTPLGCYHLLINRVFYARHWLACLLCSRTRYVGTRFAYSSIYLDSFSILFFLCDHRIGLSQDESGRTLSVPLMFGIRKERFNVKTTTGMYHTHVRYSSSTGHQIRNSKAGPGWISYFVNGYILD